MATPHDSHDALDVRFRWGDQLVAAGLFRDRPEVTVGPSARADVRLEAAHLPGEAFPLLRRDGEGWTLRFTGRMDGEVATGGGVARLRELARSGVAVRDGDGFAVALQQGDAAWVDLGHIRADVRFRTPPARVAAPLAEKLDYQLLQLLLAVCFFVSAAVISFEALPADADLVADDLFANRLRIAKVLLVERPVEPRAAAALRDLQAPADAAPAKAKRAEGAAGTPKAPVRQARSAPRAIDPDDARPAHERGLVALLGRGGPGGVASILGEKGLGGELNEAIGGITGPTASDARGLGGLGVRGPGPGGGGPGDTVGIGDLRTRGRGGGDRTYGFGVRGMERGDGTTPILDPTEPTVTGSLDKELIRRVIQEHRSQIRFCYESELVRRPQLSGKLAVRFVIGPDGAVSSAGAARSTLGSHAVEACVTARVKSWQFPRPRGGGVVVVTYPFVFQQSGL